MKRFFFFLIIAGATSCSAQNKLYKPLKIDKPEIFDLKGFNNRKNRFGQCEFETKNGLYIEQTEYTDLKQYYEFVTNRKSPIDRYYTLYKKFYENCMIKERGVFYSYNKSDVNTGTWEYFDSTGKLVKTVNHDNDYKINYRQALKIAHKKYGFKQKDVSIEIMGDDTWFIRVVNGKHMGFAVFVNAKNGESRLTQLVQNTNDEIKREQD